ncbi:zf-C3HC4-domain-containing protein [Cristinia sonorae]|uniref:Zf-C3HC4-domain-containing protein n=1 Tax=Cristinia sonorae TaxID=1940300 RepID=A0A8K0UL93_9AGAR|nr:zf-C3HC4-domain-containing protein [Cristinia sonorae]
MDDAEQPRAPQQEQSADEKQCRICLDGEDPTLGRLIRPCLCKGSISYVHVKCLQRWRLSSNSRQAFYACPQCGYRYHFARTRASGIASNPVIIAALSAILFTILVICSSYVTTWLLDDTNDSWLVLAPWALFRNLVRASVGTFDVDFESKMLAYAQKRKEAGPPSLVKRLIRRFLLGLPVVGASSVLQIVLSMPVPFHWFRWRTRRNRDSRDIATLILVFIILAGAARALWKVYQLTEKLVTRLLLRAEDAILEVS